MKLLFVFFCINIFVGSVFADTKESIEISCVVTQVNKNIVAGLNEGKLKVWDPYVDHIQPEGIVSVKAGTNQRVVRIGETTYDRDASDGSEMHFTRDSKGNWKFVIYSGEIEEGFVINYKKSSKAGTVATFTTDNDESTAQIYANLNCK